MAVSSTRAEAAAWLARLQSDARTAADEAGFRAWLADDPAHREAFDAINQTWEIAGGLAAERRRELIRRPARPDMRRRGLVAAGLGAVTVGALGGWQVAFAGVYTTAVGEQRRVALDDGSLVILDTASKIRVDFGRETRRVSLLRGRAHFQVAKDVARPFIVAADDQQVVAVGTAFDVSRTDAAVAVVVTEGQVAVRRPDAPVRLLTPGRRVVIGEGPPREDQPDLARVTAWRAGKAVFDNDPVAAAVAEMNRYSRRPIVVADPAVAGMRISGVYSTGDTEAFARSLATLLPLDVSMEPERVTLTAQKTS